MSGVALFAYGTLVTLIVTFGIGLLVWGAILDGRYEREVRARLGGSTGERPRGRAGLERLTPSRTGADAVTGRAGVVRPRFPPERTTPSARATPALVQPSADHG